jgi:ribonuclease P protein component
MERLRRRADFLAAAGGRKVATAAFVLQALGRADNGPIRVGFTVSKKVGTAVERNRVRRRLKDVVKRSAAGRLRSGHDYVLIGRRAALKLPFVRLVDSRQRCGGWSQGLGEAGAFSGKPARTFPNGSLKWTTKKICCSPSC